MKKIINKYHYGFDLSCRFSLRGIIFILDLFLKPFRSFAFYNRKSIISSTITYNCDYTPVNFLLTFKDTRHLSWFCYRPQARVIYAPPLWFSSLN